MDITQLLSTAATVAILTLGVALMIVLAVVPTWLRCDAEREERCAGAARPGEPTRTPVPAPTPAAVPPTAGAETPEHALAA